MTNVQDALGVPGKVAIVTGAGAGIGESTAVELARAGARVVVADLDKDGAERVAAAIRDDGGEATARAIDVSDHVAVTELVDGTVAEFDRLDVLVNNAGVMTRRPALEISPEEFDRILSVNLKGVLYGCQAAGRVMGRGGVIVNMLSEIIDRGTAETGAYAASKKGAEALTRTFAVELGPLGIRVNGVAPAWTISAMTMQRGIDANGAFDPQRFEEVKARLAGLSPLGVVNDAVDVARAVLYLASEAGRYINGQVIRINGGSAMV